MNRKRTSHFKLPSDEALTTTEKAAFFLDWASDARPGEYITYEEIYQSISNLPRRPTKKNKEVLVLRQKSRQIKDALRTKFRKGWDTDRTLGVRALATVDDITRTELVKKAKRMDAAKRSIEATVEIIDEKRDQFPDTKHGRELKAFYGKVKSSAKQLPGLEEFTKLLPPKE